MPLEQLSWGKPILNTMACSLQQLPSWCCFPNSADFLWHLQNGKSNRATFISDALETGSLCSLSSLFLYTWRQLLLFYSGICNRKENTRWFAKWIKIKRCQVLSGIYSQTHTPISKTVSLQYFSTKTKNGARCIIVHFFMDSSFPCMPTPLYWQYVPCWFWNSGWYIRTWLLSVRSESVNASNTIKLHEK